MLQEERPDEAEKEKPIVVNCDTQESIEILNDTCNTNANIKRTKKIFILVAVC